MNYERINRKFNLNDNTKYKIYNFINEFSECFPNIMSEEELLKRIKESLLEDIKYVSKDLLGLKVTGRYNSVSKTIYINSNITQEEQNKTLFHEFIHVITNNEYERLLIRGKVAIPYMESITTLFEEKYDKYKNNQNRDRVNGYIPNFARQLYVVYGNELLKKYLENYTDISKLFTTLPFNDFEEKMKNYDTNSQVLYNCFLMAIFDINNTINEYDDKLCKMNNKIKIYDENKQYDKKKIAMYSFEKEKNELINITIFLNYKIEKFILEQLYLNKNISNIEKYQRLNNLFLIQKTPCCEMYYKMINELGCNQLEQFEELEEFYNNYKDKRNYYKIIFEDCHDLELSMYIRDNLEEENKYFDYTITKAYEYYKNKNFYDGLVQYMEQNNVEYLNGLNIMKIKQDNSTNFNKEQFNELKAGKESNEIFFIRNFLSNYPLYIIKNEQHNFIMYTDLETNKIYNLRNIEELKKELKKYNIINIDEKELYDKLLNKLNKLKELKINQVYFTDIVNFDDDYIIDDIIYYELDNAIYKYDILNEGLDKKQTLLPVNCKMNYLNNEKIKVKS